MSRLIKIGDKWINPEKVHAVLEDHNIPAGAIIYTSSEDGYYINDNIDNVVSIINAYLEKEEGK